MFRLGSFSVLLTPALFLGVLLGVCAGNSAAKGPGRARGAPPVVEIPGFTAYVTGDPRGARVSRRAGVTRWRSPSARIAWFFRAGRPGWLEIALRLRAARGNQGLLEIRAGGKTFRVPFGGTPREGVLVPVGKVKLPKKGWYSVRVRGVKKEGPAFPDLLGLRLSGDPVRGIRYNRLPRRNCASVHLHYPLPKGTKAEWFYNEVTVPKGMDPLWTYFEVCGFRRGYFGMQVNSPKERRIIFSVWDAGGERITRKRVREEDRVRMLARGKGVKVNAFGHEGTGLHSHWVYPWKAGRTYRFAVRAEPRGKATAYSAFFYVPEKGRWKLIASFLAPKDGGYLDGLYSFIENFGGRNGYLERKAFFGNQWIRTAGGRWMELKKAVFTHDSTGGKERIDFGAGVKGNRFYIWTGGFKAGTARGGETLERKGGGRPPASLPCSASSPVKSTPEGRSEATSRRRARRVRIGPGLPEFFHPRVPLRSNVREFPSFRRGISSRRPCF